jgi:hypothetical protein
MAKEMAADLWEKLLQLIRLLRPEFYNKLTWVIVLAGLALMATPLWQDLVIAFFKKELRLDLMPGGNSAWGFALVGIGLVYHLLTTSLNQYVQFQVNKEQRAIWLEHDRRIFSEAETFVSEDEYIAYVGNLVNDHSYWMEHANKMDRLRRHLLKPEKQFLNPQLVQAARPYAQAINALMEWTAYHFFVFPEGQAAGNLRLCMHPNLNVDRGGNGSRESTARYDIFTAELDRLVDAMSTTYRHFRSEVKKCLAL